MGNGYMSQEGNVIISNNENETNQEHKFQGKFRTGKIDPDMLKYSIECDSQLSKSSSKHIFVTCMDQVDIDLDPILDYIGVDFKSVRISRGPSLKDVSMFRRR